MRHIGGTRAEMQEEQEAQEADVVREEYAHMTMALDSTPATRDDAVVRAVICPKLI